MKPDTYVRAIFRVLSETIGPITSTIWSIRQRPCYICFSLLKTTESVRSTMYGVYVRSILVDHSLCPQLLTTTFWLRWSRTILRLRIYTILSLSPFLLLIHDNLSSFRYFAFSFGCERKDDKTTKWHCRFSFVLFCVFAPPKQKYEMA